MTTETWLEIICNLTEKRPLDLDQLFGTSPQKRPIDPEFPIAVPGTNAPSARLWDHPENGTAYIGIRVRAPVVEIVPLAQRLAAAAVERRVIPIILTTLDSSGFERFGFRAERVYGANDAEKAACEAELARFWNLAIVIDAAEVSLLT